MSDDDTTQQSWQRPTEPPPPLVTPVTRRQRLQLYDSAVISIGGARGAAVSLANGSAVPEECRALRIAITKLEEARMWLAAALLDERSAREGGRR